MSSEHQYNTVIALHVKVNRTVDSVKVSKLSKSQISTDNRSQSKKFSDLQIISLSVTCIRISKYITDVCSNCFMTIKIKSEGRLLFLY